MADHNCFGCGPANAHGLKMNFFSDGECVFSRLRLSRRFCGWENIAHGGILSTILDEIMGRTVIYLLKTPGMTKSMEISFLKPVYIGEDFRAEGRIVEVPPGGREAVVDGIILNAKGEKCAVSSGRFALQSIDRIKEKGVSNQAVIDWFEMFLKEG